MQKIMMCRYPCSCLGFPEHATVSIIIFFIFFSERICRLNVGTLYYGILIFQTDLKEKNIDAIQFNLHAKDKRKRSYFGSSSLAFVAMLLAQVQNQLLLATEQEGCNFHLVKKGCFGKPAIAIQKLWVNMHMQARSVSTTFSVR